jgi:hypothetical protein
MIYRYNPMNTVTLLKTPKATQYLINPVATSKVSIQRSEESDSSAPKEPDDTQVLDQALPLGSVRSMGYQGLYITVLPPDCWRRARFVWSYWPLLQP